MRESSAGGAAELGGDAEAEMTQQMYLPVLQK
jgi:hypothetical protein